MTKIDVDTTQLKTYGNTLMNYSNQLENEIDNVFDLLSKMSVTGTWNGKAAYDYIMAVKKDKRQYKAFVNSIYKDGKVLYNIGDWKNFVDWDFYYKREVNDVYDCYMYNHDRLRDLINKIKEKDEKYRKIDLAAKSALLYNNISEIERTKKRI